MFIGWFSHCFLLFPLLVNPIDSYHPLLSIDLCFSIDFSIGVYSFHGIRLVHCSNSLPCIGCGLPKALPVGSMTAMGAMHQNDHFHDQVRWIAWPSVSHGVPRCPTVSHGVPRCPTVSHVWFMDVYGLWGPRWSGKPHWRCPHLVSSLMIHDVQWHIFRKLDEIGRSENMGSSQGSTSSHHSGDHHWSAAQWRLGDGSFGRTCRSNCSMFMPLDKIEKKRIEWQAIVPHRLAELA